MYMQNDTGRDIANAIGDITFDTSGLAKDTTLQNTNAALGDINTTLQGITTSDPPTDTTQQSIASAISGLANAVKPDASDIPYDSNITVKGKIDEIANNSIISIGNEIASGTSLNNITTPGLYYFTASSNISDAPFTNNSACNLYVLPRSGITSRVFQVIIGYLSTGCSISIRAMSGANTWTAWRTLDDTTLTLSRTENSYVNTTNFARLYASRINRMLVLNGNLALSSAIPSGALSDFVEIGQVSGWNAPYTYYQNISGQMFGDTICVSIDNGGVIRIFAPSARTDWYRFTACMPSLT